MFKQKKISKKNQATVASHQWDAPYVRAPAIRFVYLPYTDSRRQLAEADVNRRARTTHIRKPKSPNASKPELGSPGADHYAIAVRSTDALRTERKTVMSQLSVHRQRRYVSRTRVIRRGKAAAERGRR